jgi:hypothetical protein
MAHMGPQLRTADEIVAQVASRSHGVVARADLLAAGVSSEQIRQRLDRGILIAIHRGVYRVGHTAPSREATYLAAVKACGPAPCSAVARPPTSGASSKAVHLHLRSWHRASGGLRGSSSTAPAAALPPSLPVFELRTPPSDGSPTPPSASAFPVTTVPRTLADLASVLPGPALARACHEAGVLHRTTPRQVSAILARRPNARGARSMRRVMDGDEPAVLSRLEALFLKRLREANLPLPETNRPAEGRRVDCRWPEHRFTVELDSYRFHSSRHAWERDRQREREARARGDEFRRYTWADVEEEPEAMLRELERLLGSP